MLMFTQEKKVLSWLREKHPSQTTAKPCSSVANQVIRRLRELLFSPSALFPIAHVAKAGELQRDVEYIRLYGLMSNQLLGESENVSFDVIIYELTSAMSKMYHAEGLGESSNGLEVLEPIVSNVLDLPARALDDIWDSLIFRPPIHEHLLTSLINYGTSLPRYLRPGSLI